MIDTSLIRIVCAVLAVLFLGLIVLRTKRGVSEPDLIQYAVLIVFVVVAAGALMPGVTNSIHTIFQKIEVVMATAKAEALRHQIQK
jgi:hypothetical protein